MSMGYYVLDEIEKGDYKFSLDTFLGDPAANICCWVYYKGKPLNIEGTNDQVHKVFPQDHGSVNRSHLLQWMWRSQIRNGKPIDIYIPSERMRELLNNWIQNCYVTEKAA